MARQETSVSTLKINRGTRANIEANLASMGENELIITTDENESIPSKTSDLINDSNFVSDANYEHIDKSDVTSNTSARHTHSNKTTLDGITNDNLVTSSDKAAWNAKQNAIDNTTDLNVKTITGGITYTTTAPTAVNNDGLKIVVLTSEPATKYDGWWYIIIEAQSTE